MMRQKVIRFYPDLFFKVEYIADEFHLDFAVYGIRTLDTDHPEKSEIDEDEVMTGFIKWDGCMDFNYSDHYCYAGAADKFAALIKEIYKYKSSLGDPFTQEEI